MKPHTTDAVSLVFGAIFLGIAMLWLVARFVTVGWSWLGWSAALGLTLVGIGGIVYAVIISRRGRPE